MTSRFFMLLAAVAPLLRGATSIELDINSPDSIKAASSTIAHGLMTYYTNNQTDTDPTKVGTFPDPLYWWEGGAVWGGMVDYWAYTGDTSYNPTVAQGLLAQVGPDNNYMPPAYHGSLGNDDQAFWAMACLSAHEYGFPVPVENASPTWLDLAVAVFNTQILRWDMTECNGGLQWQVYDTNPGWNYKNSVSNGALFQISARLAQITGNQTYVEWCDKIWDWMWGVHLISEQYDVSDGTTPSRNCTNLEPTVWSYNPSMMLYGAAVVYNYTNGDSVWAKRTTGLLTACQNTFFSPYPNATNIMYERACEPNGSCNNDQFSFKAYLARWLAKSAIVAPHIRNTVTELLTTSASAAAQACSGGEGGTACGQKWYVGGYDGSVGIGQGVGQQLSALETVQALLLLQDQIITPQRSPEQGSDLSSVQDGTQAAQSSPAQALESGSTPPTTVLVIETRTRQPVKGVTRTTTTTKTIPCSSTAAGTIQLKQKRHGHIRRHDAFAGERHVLGR